MVATSPAILVMHPSSPRRSLAEFIALAKAQPGKDHARHGGVGATTHVVGELFQLRARRQAQSRSRTGTGPAFAGYGRRPVPICDQHDASARCPYTIRSTTRTRIAGKKRRTAIPDVPDHGEAGIKASKAKTGMVCWPPTGVPQTIRRHAHREIVKAVNQPQVRERLAALPARSDPSTPANSKKCSIPTQKMGRGGESRQYSVD